MEMKFYRVESPYDPGKLAGVVVYEGVTPFRWYPTTGLWHRDYRLQRDIFLDSHDLCRVSAEEALRLCEQFQVKLDRRNKVARSILDEIEQAPLEDTRSFAQLGLPSPKGARHLSGRGVRNWLSKVKVGEAVPVAFYPRGKKHNAIAYVSAVERGEPKSLPGQWKATCVSDAGGWKVLLEKKQEQSESSRKNPSAKRAISRGRRQVAKSLVVQQKTRKAAAVVGR